MNTDARIYGAWLAMAAALLLVLVPGAVGQARAEIRQHLLVDGAPDADEMLRAFDELARAAGFDVYFSGDRPNNAAHNGVTLSMRQVDYSLGHADGRNISVSFFILTDPDPEAIEALRAWISYNYGYGNNSVQIRGLGALSWYEWSPQYNYTMQTLESDLGDWREKYVESE